MIVIGKDLQTKRREVVIESPLLITLIAHHFRQFVYIKYPHRPRALGVTTRVLIYLIKYLIEKDIDI